MTLFPRRQATLPCRQYEPSTMTTMRGLFCLLVVAASVLPEPVVGQQQQLDRNSYVPYPHSADELLLEEVATIGSPLALEVVTNVAHPEQSNQVWQLLKGVVRRMHNQNQIFMSSNHGRYCVIPAEASEDPEKNSRGKLLVEETLRRICFIQLYHGSDLRFWEYMEHFDSFGCHDAADMATCSSRALGAIPRVEYRAIENCMHTAGGLEGDSVNIHLKTHMDRQFKRTFPYSSVDVPFVRFGEQKYTGVKDTKHILEWICNTFELKKGVTPVACTFCSHCLAVEACLWYLDCDGTPFTVEAFQSTAATTAVPAIDMEPATTMVTQPAGQEAAAVTSSEPVEAAPGDETTEIGPLSATTVSATTAAPEPQQTSAVIGDLAPSDFANGETFIPFTHAPSTTSPASAPVDLNYEVSTTTSSHADTSDYHKDKDSLYKQEATADYVLPVIIVVSLLSVYFILSYCFKSYKNRKKNERQRTAEAYFDDLLEASYADNLAVSGRIDEDKSDRDFEDAGLDESYRYPDEVDYSRNIRQGRESSSSDDEESEGSSARLSATREPPKPPPLYSFKVHQVLG
ncbi:Vacuolar-sorting receptor [Seminavis robusta]|uniref:Vacuolar-sorting receptor n=1 Tax=Seminavis robusta TaxID=568900 RepID=A0A9N8DY85_9STRA|nr:Vacuolar-sorting receptor [Seminavis robusta]|eukprot:Sro372_g128860.1 Vacuolar-sorting receptor (572) ;mRNA; f:52080-54059